jgi:heptosyltransferase-2
VLAAARRPLFRPDCGQPTIDTLKATVSLLELLVCNDSGARHVAVAFKVPALSILGPTSPAYSSGPYEQGEVLRVDVDCGPCQRPTCRTDHRCMTRISTERVVEAALRYLAR